MRKILYISGIMLIFACTANSLFAQRSLVNNVWQTKFDSPNDTVPWGNSAAVVSNGNIVVVGNTDSSNGHTYISTRMISPNGTCIWHTKYNYTNANNDFGGRVVSSGSYVYVAAASFSSQYDLVLIKYDINGSQQWIYRVTNFWGGGDAFPVSMTVDADGNVYLAASVFVSGQGMDMAGMKVNPDGSLAWFVGYDFNGYDDFATGIALGPDGSVYVSGDAGNSNTDRDFAIIKFDNSTGSILTTKQESNPDTSLDIATAIKADASGNVYVTGAASNDGVHFYNVTNQYDASLTKVVADTFMGDSLYVEARIMQMDASNNIYVGGYEKKQGGRSTYYINKYNTGYLVWSREYYGNYQNHDLAQLTGLFIDSNANVFVTGNILNGSSQHIASVLYDSAGEIQWEKIYGAAGQTVIASDITAHTSGEVYVTGIQNGNYFTKKYQSLTYTESIVNDTESKPWYVAHQLLINFDPSIVNTTIVNDRDTVYSQLRDFIGTAAIDSMDRNLGLSGDGSIGYASAIKMYKKLRTTDTISIGRTGDTVPIPPFWSHLLIQLPSGLNELTSADTLEKLSFIIFAQPNYVYQLASAPDSNYATKQLSLHSNGTYSNADINIDSAWLKTKGDTNIRIGNYDSGILWEHKDFGGSSNSKVTGYDYVNNVGINNSHSMDTSGHGTAMAGIFGANSNNGKGITGIAGGDGSISKLTGTGCGLVAMKITYGTQGTTIDASDLAGAIADGVFSRKLNVINASWYNYVSYSPEIETDIKYAYNNDVVFVAAMGNNGHNFAATSQAYPADYRANWIMAVGASGIDGKFQNNQTNIGSSHLSGDAYESNYGAGIVDLIAPGDDHMVYTTSKASTNSYAGANGTSASAAHVSGVSGLILTYGENYFGAGTNFTADDVQTILKDTANSSGMGISTFPDNKVGYGRLDGAAALAFVDKSKFNIRHIEYQQGQPGMTVTATEVDPGHEQTLVLDQDELDTLIAGNILVTPDTYTVKTYKVTMTIPYTVKAHAHVLDCWPRLNFYQETNAEARTLYDNNVLDMRIEPGFTVQTFTHGYAIVTGYLYNLISSRTGGFMAYGTWLGADATSSYMLNRLQASITIRTDEPQVASIQPEKPATVHGIYPNPANNQVAVAFNMPAEANVDVEVIDIQGRVLTNTNYGHQPAGDNLDYIDVSKYQPGMYIVRLQVNDAVYYDKFIKK